MVPDLVITVGHCAGRRTAVYGVWLTPFPSWVRSTGYWIYKLFFQGCNSYNQLEVQGEKEKKERESPMCFRTFQRWKFTGKVSARHFGFSATSHRKPQKATWAEAFRFLCQREQLQWCSKDS